MSLTKHKPPVKGAGDIARPRTRKPAPATPPAFHYTPAQLAARVEAADAPANKMLTEIHDRLSVLADLAARWLAGHGKHCGCAYCRRPDHSFGTRGAAAEYALRGATFTAEHAASELANVVIEQPNPLPTPGPC